MRTNCKKLSLHVDDLKVEAFATVAGQVERGTVRGHYDTNGCSAATDCTRLGYSCEGQFCPVTYPYTCEAQYAC